MSLMRRVTERDSTAIPETQTNAESASQPQTPRVPRGKSADLHSVLLDVQRRMMGEGTNVINIKDEALIRQTIDELMTVILAEQGLILNKVQRKEFLEQLVNEILGFGPLEQLLADTSTTDIMVIGPERIYVERMGKLYKTSIKFQDDDHLMRIIDRMLAPLGRRVDESSPMVDARLPDGSRINVVVPPVALDGAALTVRKFAVVPLSVTDLINYGTATEQVFEFMQGAVIAGMNIIVAGGSSSGKTTLLNVMSGYVPDDERIVTMENAAELQLRQHHVVRMESRPSNMEGKGEISIRDLVINSLRMRPDRIVVGEVRGGEALDLLQAMNTGHEGSMGTLHANSPHDALSRLETMVLGAGMNLPIRAIREQMASAINLIIHMGRDREGVRRILNISEVMGLEGDTVSLSEIFRFERTPGAGDGVLMATGILPRCLDRIADAGVRFSPTVFQPSNRSVNNSRVRTVESSSGSSRPAEAAARPTLPPMESFQAPPQPVQQRQVQPPAPQQPTVEFANMDDVLEDYPIDTQADVSVQLPEPHAQLPEPHFEEPEPPAQQPGITDSQTIKRGLLGRYGTNQGSSDHDHEVT